GAVFVPVNPSLKAAQVGHILRDCDCVALITTGAQGTSLGEVLADCPALRRLVLLEPAEALPPLPPGAEAVEWAALAGAAIGAPVRRIDAGMAPILYTSGGTGKPKGVVLSHRNMVAGALSVASYLENRPDDVILAVLPFSFDAGFSQTTTAFSV